MNLPAPDAPQSRAGLRLLLLLGFLSFTVFLFLLAERAGWLAYLQDQTRLQSFVEQLGLLGPLAIIILLAVAIVISPIPSAPVALVSGALYGHGPGTLYVVLGSVTGAMLAFTIARRLGQDYVNHKLMQNLPVKLVGSQNTLMAIVFASRLAPFISFDVISYAAGLTCLSYGRFLLATLAGIVPISFVLAHLGSEVSNGEMGSIANAILLLGLFTLLPFIINLLRRRLRGD